MSTSSRRANTAVSRGSVEGNLRRLVTVHVERVVVAAFNRLAGRRQLLRLLQSPQGYASVAQRSMIG